MDVIVNWFLILLMLVFQPLAIALILVALFAFSSKAEEDKVEETVPEPVPVEEVTVIEEKTPKVRKKREKKVPDETEMDYPKTFNIEIEGLEPGDNFALTESKPEEVVPKVEEKKPEKKPRKRKIVEIGLPDDLASHLSDSLSKKKG